MINSITLKQQLEKQLKEEEVFLLFSKANPIGSEIVFEDMDGGFEINDFDGVIKDYNFETSQILVEEPNSFNKYTHFIGLRSVKKPN